MNQSSIQALAESRANDYVEKELHMYNIRYREAGRKDFTQGFIAGLSERIDTDPLVSALKKICRPTTEEDAEDWHFFANQLRSIAREALNNVQVVQPAKTDGGTIPYLKSEMEGQLIRMKALGIDYEKSGHTFEQAVNTVIFMAAEKVQPGSVKGTPVWVKATDRLPGWDVAVQWRHNFVNRMGKETLGNLQFVRPVSFKEYEWFDENAVTNPHTDKQRTTTADVKVMLLKEYVNDLPEELPDPGQVIYELCDMILSLDESPSVGADNGREASYWKDRCEAAERFIEESPCDPDITKEQIAAHSEWQEIKAKHP